MLCPCLPIASSAWPGARLFAERPTSASPWLLRSRAFLSSHHRLTGLRAADEERDGASRCARAGWTVVNATACPALAELTEARGDAVAVWVGAFTCSVRDCSLASKVAEPL
jgi:hypothetical protein